MLNHPQWAQTVAQRNRARVDAEQRTAHRNLATMSGNVILTIPVCFVWIATYGISMRGRENHFTAHGYCNQRIVRRRGVQAGSLVVPGRHPVRQRGDAAHLELPA
jgi:hypothetical protein